MFEKDSFSYLLFVPSNMSIRTTAGTERIAVAAFLLFSASFARFFSAFAGLAYL
jgi:hypothetical protein